MLLKIIIYLLCVLITLQKAKAKPIPCEKIKTFIVKNEHMQKSTDEFENVASIHGKRKKRQVVQPKWLSGKDEHSPFVDPRVRVTDESLREAAAIRAAIQKTIDEDTFVVNPDQPSNIQTPPNTAPAPTHPQNIPNTPAPTDFFKFSANQQKTKFPTFQMNFPFFETDFSAFQNAFKSSFNSFASFVGSTQTQSEPAAVVAAEHEHAPEPAPADEADLQSSQRIDNPTVSLAENKVMAEFEKNWLEFVQNSKKMWSPEALADNEFVDEFKSLWLEFLEASKEMMTWDFLDLLD